MVDVLVIGAGLAGLTAAYRLLEAGLSVRVLERYPAVGGLARVTEVGGERIETFYHHLFTSDAAYVALAGELGLAADIEWLPSRMGVFTAGRLWDFGTPASLLRFQPLPLADKLRFVITTLRLQRARDPRPYEDVTAADWLRRHAGERVWQTVWRPLLVQKFAGDAERVAMVWLQRKLYLRGRSRSRSGFGERLGYLRGSFARLPEELTRRLEAGGGELRTGDPVRRVEGRAGSFTVSSRSGEHAARAVLAAVPVADYLDFAGHLLPPAAAEPLRRLRATATICTLLELDRRFTPYYWLNIADPDMPFGGLIEQTNYIPKERYGGRHLLYVSNYLAEDHPLYRAPVGQVLAAYAPGLRRVNPGFDESWIRAVHHARAAWAQPIVTPGYRALVPAMRTPVPGLYLTTMAQVYPEDRGQNYAIAYAESAVRTMLADRPEWPAPG